MLDFFRSNVFNRTIRRHIGGKLEYYGPVGQAPHQSISSLDQLQEQEQEQEQVGEDKAQETDVDSDPESDPELEHSSKRVPRWSALVLPANMNPVDWQIKFALDGEDEMDAPSKETEQASCSSAQQLTPKPKVSTINTFAEREHGM